MTKRRWVIRNGCSKYELRMLRHRRTVHCRRPLLPRDWINIMISDQEEREDA